MTKLLISVILLIYSNSSIAGGDYVIGRVTSFVGSGSDYSFRFIQTNSNFPLLFPNCPEFEIKVNYQRVPWYSWMPFIHTTHPTPKDTKNVGLTLLEAYKSGKEVSVGYMGSGFKSTDTHCSYISRGFSNKGGLLLSFYNPV